MLTNPDASGQHKMKSFIHHIVDPRISDPAGRDASKVVGMTPGEPLCHILSHLHTIHLGPRLQDMDVSPKSLESMSFVKRGRR